jgi:hypothetical protein
MYVTLWLLSCVEWDPNVGGDYGRDANHLRLLALGTSFLAISML